MSKLNYYPIELHTHTNNSDGRFTEADLINAAKDFGYAGIFSTDHNNIAAYETIKKEKLDESLDFKVLPGIEWTTFYGHMLILGGVDPLPFTLARKDNINELVKRIKEREDVVVGIAHPYVYGTPACKGCFWEFEVKDYNDFDYIEIANNVNPHIGYWNEDAYELWVDQINKGVKIAMACGRDWHGPTEGQFITYVTMLGLESDINTSDVVNAIRNGKTYITMEPILDLSINDDSINLGDEIENQELSIKLTLNKGEFKDNKASDFILDELRIINNDDTIENIKPSYGETYQFNIEPNSGSIRFEVYGYLEETKIRLLVTSAIFVK